MRSNVNYVGIYMCTMYVCIYVRMYACVCMYVCMLVCIILLLLREEMSEEKQTIRERIIQVAQPVRFTPPARILS